MAQEGIKNYIKFMQVIFLTLIILFVFMSFGIMGKQLTYYFELMSESELEHIDKEATSYRDSMKAIIAWNVFICLFIPLYLASTWFLENGSKWFKLMTFLYIFGIWFPRWLAGIVFLEGNRDYRDGQYLQEEYIDENEGYCEQELFIRQCAITKSYVQSIEYETFFVIVFFLLGILIVPVLYKINKEKLNSFGVKYRDTKAGIN